MSRIRTHPGEVLREEFMEPLNMSAGKIAKAIGVPRDRIEKLSREQKGMSADTALRLSKLFGTTPDFWMNLQSSYELSVVKSQNNFDDIHMLDSLQVQ
ncbi:HigA family addiction module antitoxin [Terasakiella sp. A23]|uniref:HigA family addiction module antitoxin n=1 Tax=Terasakiella sp. FCG-A23 TaxID=3080561 RepID=UPI0029530FC0|nr:HigA family addiction module antitoxin [Terasakiella sp. A23]MDV7341310.1 HigA family addiction module antitoxin [Terasakiella sp. A23]